MSTLPPPGSVQARSLGHTRLRPGERVSIVCVFNDIDVRRQCLDRSLEVLSDPRQRIDYIPVDNTTHQFPTAGSALNHGAALAQSDYVVFVHQDVYLHSLTALEEAAAVLADRPEFGLLGAVGVDASARIVGRIRDRVVLSGSRVSEPTDVDSVDEVLFMAPRQQILDNPLTEDPDLAWHAYAVEYGARLQTVGRRVGVVDIPLTHNSLTINLERLDVAHKAVGSLHPTRTPLNTTCGRIPGARLMGESVLPVRWSRRQARWIRDSLAVARATRGWRSEAVLADLTRDIDTLLDAHSSDALRVINVNDDTETTKQLDPLTLTRRGRAVELLALPLDQALESAEARQGRSLVLTNLAKNDLSVALRRVAGPTLVGYAEHTGFWLLLGPLAKVPLQEWESRLSRPLGLAARLRR